MGMDWNEWSHISSGGTELMGRRIEQRLPADLLEKFQIMLSRFTADDPGRTTILWSHTSYDDPQSHHLAARGWRRYERIVFVSHWQAQAFVDHYGIPWSRCAVIPNAIAPLPADANTFATPAPGRPVRLIYTANPTRGLLLLYHAFRSISEIREDVELDVYSSLGLYGWHDADRRLDPLYDLLRGHPKINYHGSVPNDQVRDALGDADVFVYPCTTPETSCLALIEAMSAGLACVHPHYGGLSETAAGHTIAYPFDQNPAQHATTFRDQLLAVIAAVRAGDEGLRNALIRQKAFADEHFGLDRRARQWESLLRGILACQKQSSG